jgi:hypothetical protein
MIYTFFIFVVICIIMMSICTRKKYKTKVPKHDPLWPYTAVLQCGQIYRAQLPGSWNGKCSQLATCFWVSEDKVFCACSAHPWCFSFSKEDCGAQLVTEQDARNTLVVQRIMNA